MHFYRTFGGSGLYINLESNGLFTSDPRAYAIGNALASILLVMLGLLPLALTFIRYRSGGPVGLLRRVDTTRAEETCSQRWSPARKASWPWREFTPERKAREAQEKAATGEGGSSNQAPCSAS